VYHGGVAPTLAANATNRTNVVMVVSNNELRHLTEIECERLMGWNDDHTRFRADGTETASPQRYKMCGNGVAAPVATWIGERVIEAIRTDKELEQ
jgi:DNA (cytosine-5)-methyltransferase 1